MPRCDNSAPRKKLPPPTTIATSTVRAASAISLASELTTSGFTPSAPPPNASPESFSITLRLRSVIPDRPSRLVKTTGSPAPAQSRFRGRPPMRRAAGSGCPSGHGKGSPDRAATRTPLQLLGADLEASEVAHREARVGEHLGDGQLVVLRVVLLQQCDLLEVRAEAAFDDLRKGGLGLALLAGDLLDDRALLLDRVIRHVFTRQVLGVRERDVLGDAAGRLSIVAGVAEHDADLRGQVLRRLVQVDRELLALDEADAAELDLLAEDRRLIADHVGDGLAVGRCRERGLDRVGASRGDRSEHAVCEADELVALGD